MNFSFCMILFGILLYLYAFSRIETYAPEASEVDQEQDQVFAELGK